MCFYDTKAKHKASLFTAIRKLENISPSLPSRLAPLLSPEWRMCPHLAGINLLVYLDFPSLICLNEINSHSCGQIYPKLELYGYPSKPHPKRDSTNSNNRLNNTILGTWSINHCKYGARNTLGLVIPRYYFYKGFVKICFTTRNK